MIVDSIGKALYVGGGLFWNAFWALAFGYAISSLIQILIPREIVAKFLGKDGIKQTLLGMILGPASSSCSFAALSAGRALLAKDAALIPMMAFLFGATNLSPQVAILAWIFLGWQFALALIVGALVLVAIMAALVNLTYPKKMLKNARKAASKVGEKETGMSDPSEGLPESWGKKLKCEKAWYRIGVTYLNEWKMVWKDLLFGFVIAGGVATLVPDNVFKAIFPQDLVPALLVPIHALLGPLLALLTVIGSMGNGPLAAVLWENGVLFSGIIAFLYADFVVIPALRINANYYGWRFAAYLGLIFSISAVGAGIVIYLLFKLIGLIPEAEAGRVQELAQFKTNYVFYLNLIGIIISLVLIWLSLRKGKNKTT